MTPNETATATAEGIVSVGTAWMTNGDTYKRGTELGFAGLDFYVTGRGGTLGTPSQLLDESPPGADQEGNWVVSGGGLVGPDDDDTPGDASRRSPSGSAPHRV